MDLCAFPRRWAHVHTRARMFTPMRTPLRECAYTQGNARMHAELYTCHHAYSHVHSQSLILMLVRSAPSSNPHLCRCAMAFWHEHGPERMHDASCKFQQLIVKLQLLHTFTRTRQLYSFGITIRRALFHDKRDLKFSFDIFRVHFIK